MPERTFDDFDEFARDYRQIHNENIRLSGADSMYFAEMKVRLLKEFETDQPLKVLDIGCGDGTTEIFISRYFSSWRVTGIDVSSKSIEEANTQHNANTSFQVYDGLNIPLSKETCDIVFMAGVLHHVDHTLHEQLLKEVHRVLKPGGRFYLYEHNPLNPVTRYLVNTCVFDKDARLLKHAYTSELLKKTGLEIDKKNFIIFFPRKGIFMKLLFLEKYLKWLPLGGQYFIRSVRN
jgi:ubiquinone/menaquinone biosynthesis C-methylase UbiE